MPGPSPAPPAKQRSRISFPEELPISARVGDIAEALTRHQVVIVVGATGSGKTTQLPKIALEMGRGGRRQIGVTQPRRIAATSVAARVAKELDCELGNEVGYQIRFEDRTCPNTWVKFMTDGILLAEIQRDRTLQAYDTLIIDEAHERSLNIDFLLGWLKRILPKRRDLKVVVSSATIASERFSEFFDGAPVVEVEGRTYPVEVLYEPPVEDVDLAEAVTKAVADITALDPHGDVLVFLPGEREIRESELALIGSNLRHTEILPLYARLSSGDQAKVFTSGGRRRVILATNVAETSLTIPGIVYVVDTGIARISRYDARTGTTRLQVEPISRASADQRKGRCGRVREGVCVRLYDEANFQARPAFTDPEMKRTGLAGVILRMKALGLGNVEDFPLIDPPSSRSVAEGYRVLEELGALTEERTLTDMGRRLAEFPVDPRIGRMVLAGAESGCLDEVLTIAAALSIQDPRERPRGQEQKADQLHQRFRDEGSDFLGLLRLWNFLREHDQKSRAQLRRACKENFLSFVRVRDWIELRRQLADQIRELRLAPQNTAPAAKGTSAPAAKGTSAPEASRAEKDPPADALHQALLTGLLSRIGQWNAEQRVYMGARQTRFTIHPSSGLAKKPPAWVMAFELVETRQLFARTAAKIEPSWLERIGQHLVRRSYSDPNWSMKSGRASVKEHVTLFGLSVSKDRSVDYSTIAPARARMMFIEHALVRGEYQSRGSFSTKNRALLEEVARLRDKARQSDMLADDEHLFDFFERRIPESVVNGKTFEAWRDQAEKDSPNLLVLSLEDVLVGDGAPSAKDYPDQIEVHGVPLPAHYRFDPAADDDGITLDVPLTLLPQLTQRELDWTIAPWHERKIAALLEELPRTLRRELAGRADLASTLAGRITPSYGPILPLLSQTIRALAGVEIPIESFRVDAIPRYLQFNLRIVDENAKVLGEGRDLTKLHERFGVRAREIVRGALVDTNVPASRATSWKFGDIPNHVSRQVQDTVLRCYPALEDRETAVELRLFESEDAAKEKHRAGVRRLLALALRGKLAELASRLPAPFPPPPGLNVARSARESFNAVLLGRVLDDTFALHRSDLPRTKDAFERLLASGSPRLVPTFDAAARALSAAKIELEKLNQAMTAASKHPSGAAATADIRNQVTQLLPTDLVARTDLARLGQLPRYLRAAQIRLQRAVVDPRKDAAKAAPVQALWNEYLARAASPRDHALAERLRWSFEELRVAVFAPELKPAESVTIANLAALVDTLG